MVIAGAVRAARMLRQCGLRVRARQWLRMRTGRAAEEAAGMSERAVGLHALEAGGGERRVFARLWFQRRRRRQRQTEGG